MIHQELMSVTINVQSTFDGIPLQTTLLEMFVAPSTIVRAFADFLSCRDDEETFTVQGMQVPFLECSVKVGDSKKAVAAFECLKHYDLQLTTHSICADLVNCLSNSEYAAWNRDANLLQFVKWFKENEKLIASDY